MEFLNYKDAVAELKRAGVHEQNNEANRLRFCLEAEHTKEPSRVAVCQACAGSREAMASISAPPEECVELRDHCDRLPSLAEDIIHAHRATETLLIPCASWRPIIDLAAFELATDEAWLEVDAEASLHQNGRDPLILTPHDLHVLPKLLGALCRGSDASAEDGAHDLTIVAPGAGIVLAFSANGLLRLECRGQAIADEFLELARGD